MSDVQEPTVQRRTVVKSAAWAAPVVAAGALAPTAAASTGDCYTGNFSGAFSTVYGRSFTPVTYDGVLWRRFDFIATITDTYPGFIVNTLDYVVPWAWSGPQENNSNGPWTAATWDNAAGVWTSNRAESAGKRIFVSNYQTSTPAPRSNFLQYTAAGTSNPLITTSLGPSAAQPPNSTATIGLSDQVYVIPITPMPATVGSVSTALYSVMVEAGPGTGVMSSATWGSYWGTGCDL